MMRKIIDAIGEQWCRLMHSARQIRYAGQREYECRVCSRTYQVPHFIYPEMSLYALHPPLSQRDIEMAKVIARAFRDEEEEDEVPF